MEITILGLPQSGKTTVFNAVTRGNAQVSAYSNKPNIGVAKVPDERLVLLSDLFKPERTVQAEVTYTDLPVAPQGLGKTQGISGEYLNMLQRSDALVLVIRDFEDPSVPSFGDSVDSEADLNTMFYELVFADLEIVGRRIDKLESNKKGLKAQQLDEANYELEFLSKLKQKLEEGVGLWDYEYTDKDMKLLSGFQLLTVKPLIVVINIGEENIGNETIIEDKLSGSFSKSKIITTCISGKTEMDLSQMDEDEEKEFRDSLGLQTESGLNRMLRLSYGALDLISFITVGEDEVRAWPITKGTSALKASGKIHSDLERGFIRAEVISYEDMKECQTLAIARERGLLRQEGKDYIVGDGEIMHVLFNV
tara:strand:- start:344 stop:1438 length:1095 start_codon:yes stop_codon:yes gene_type:complete